MMRGEWTEGVGEDEDEGEDEDVSYSGRRQRRDSHPYKRRGDEGVNIKRNFFWLSARCSLMMCSCESCAAQCCSFLQTRDVVCVAPLLSQEQTLASEIEVVCDLTRCSAAMSGFGSSMCGKTRPVLSQYW